MAVWILIYSHPILASLVIVGLLTLMWVRYVQGHYNVFTHMGIPGPEPSFLFGNTMAFANKFALDVFRDWASQYGKVFGFYEGLRPSIVVSCPKLAHKILVKHFNQFSTRPVINPFKHEHQDLSLQNVSGELWKRQRQAVSAGMTAKSIREMFPTMCDVTNQLMVAFDQLIKGHPEGFYVDDIAERYSLDWFAHAALCYHSDALSNENCLLLRYMRASHKSMSPENAITGFAKLFPVLTPFLKPLDTEHREMSRLQTEDVRNYVRSLQMDICGFKSSSIHNIIYHLLTKKVSVYRQRANNSSESEIVDKGNNSSSRKTPLNESEIIGEVSGLVGGGVGPFSSALTFCIYCLAVYKEEQDKLRAELRSVTSLQNTVTLEELHRLDALGRFISETLRHYPVAPGVSRECLEDCTIDGVPFHQGTVVRIMSSVMYGMEEFFPNPHAFEPDRFKRPIPSTSLHSSIHPMTSWMPFGQGPRMCVGQRLAEIALRLAVARLLQEYEISTSSVTQIPLQLALRPFVVPKDGVHVKMTPVTHSYTSDT